MIEAVAQRWYGHYEGDAAAYFAKGEIAELRENNDPLKFFRTAVAGHVTDSELAAIDEEVAALVDESVVKARASDFPSLDTLTTDVYTSH